MDKDVNRQWRLVRRPEDNIRQDDFQLTEALIPTLEQGQVLVRNLWLSFDPTQRGWMTRDRYVPMILLGDVMRAASAGQAIQSKHPGYKAGELVQGAFGWQDYIASDGAGFLPMRKLPPNVPSNLALSLFGITGPTAYFGDLDVGQIKAGKTFVVSGAAGATGLRWRN
jgi:NADPH-dependent curcumin reductase CurA